MATALDSGPAELPSAVRRGPGRWAHSYLMMMRFDFRGLGQWLIIGVVIQVLMGAGAAIMYGFYLGELPEIARLFIATGVPAIGLIPMGFVMVPNMVGQQRIAGTYDFIWSLPVPRLAAAASTFTVFTLMALPGFISSLSVGVWFYDVSLAVSWLIVPAVLLTALMSTSVGFGLAHAIKNPVVINFIANMVIFFVLLFSPIIVPIAQFPDWLALVNRVLPFYHMAQVIRDALTGGLVSNIAASYVTLGIWTVVGWTATAWVVGRRG